MGKKKVVVEEVDIYIRFEPEGRKMAAICKSYVK